MSLCTFNKSSFRYLDDLASLKNFFIASIYEWECRRVGIFRKQGLRFLENV